MNTQTTQTYTTDLVEYYNTEPIPAKLIEYIIESEYLLPDNIFGDDFTVGFEGVEDFDRNIVPGWLDFYNKAQPEYYPSDADIQEARAWIKKQSAKRIGGDSGFSVRVHMPDWVMCIPHSEKMKIMDRIIVEM